MVWVTIFILGIFCFKSYSDFKKTREIFVNHVFFLVRDINTELDKTNSDIYSIGIDFNKLEAYFSANIYAEYAGSEFGFIAETLSETNDEEYMSSLKKQLGNIILKMSDVNDNLAENPDLTYYEVNEIFYELFNIFYWTY